MKNSKLLYLIIGFPFLFGFIVDCLIKSGILTYYIVVNENYIFYVFSLIFTVATLGCTLLSIIVSVSGNRVLGLKLREIVSLTNSPLKLNTMIIGSLLIVGLSVPALAFDLTTSISMLAVFLIIFIIVYTIKLYKLVFEKSYTKNIVKEYLNDSNNVKPEYIQYWITALYRSMKENDIASEEEYLGLLCSAAEAQQQYCEQIEKQIPELFATSRKSQSFIDSFIRIIRLNEPSKSFFDERTIVLNYLKTIRYAEPKMINEINLSGTIDAIIMCKYLSNDNKVTYSYCFFNEILNNINSESEEKLSIVYNGLCRLMWLKDKIGFGDVRVNVALYLLKENVLKAKDFTFGKEIYKIMIKAMYKENRSYSTKHIASLLSQMIRMIFFWSFLEETLSKKQREHISKIPLCTVDTIDNAVISIQTLINIHHEKMLEFLISDAFQSEKLDPLDYWPEIHNGKTVVYSSENKIKFAFWFFIIWGYGFYAFPIKNYVKIDTKENQIKSKRLCMSILEEFDNKQKLINQHTKNKISQLQSFFKNTSPLPKNYISSSYDIVNELIININQLQYNPSFDNDTNIIINYLNKSISKKSDIPLDTNISLKSSIKYQLPLILCSNTIDYCKSIVSSINYYFVEIVNNLIKQRLPKIRLTFDEDGVKALKNELENGDYLFRNYTFYDDWALSKDVRKMPEYAELIELVDGIEEKRNYNLHENLFLKVDDVKFNYSVESMTIEKIEGEILEEFLSQYRVSDGQYEIDGGIYNKVNAIEHFCKTRFLLNSEIKVETNITSESGFRVVFRNNP